MQDEAAMAPAILLKAGELFLKGGNRPAFIELLVSNIREMAGRDFPSLEIREGVGKFLVTGCGHDPGLVEMLARVFGINLVEEVFICPPRIEAIEEAAVNIVRPLAGAFPRQAPSFRVDCRRTWKKFPVSSMDTARRVGERIVRAFGLKVDLESAQVTLKIMIEARRVFLSVASRRGAGGLPLGISGRALLLLSGGIDSPVAGWLAMRRGLDLECLHFHSPPYTGSAVLRKVENLVRALARFSPRIALRTAQLTGAQEFIRDNVREDHRVVMLRWAMVKVASAFARSGGIGALVTGENLGQVASQTLENLACIEKASLLPLIRPLIAFDKTEIMKLARELGTFDISIGRAEDCCSIFVPRHPVTRADMDLCRKYDALLQEKGIYEECLAGIREQ
jgi:thiamine biosynthesis protein ThiI